MSRAKCHVSPTKVSRAKVYRIVRLINLWFVLLKGKQKLSVEELIKVNYTYIFTLLYLVFLSCLSPFCELLCVFLSCR